MRRSNKPKELTRCELEIMRIIWDLDKCFVCEIVDSYPQPRPAYTTIVSTVTVLETKGYISHKTFGKQHQYYPLVSKHDYAGRALRLTMQRFFNDSPSQMLSFINESGTLSVSEYEQLRKVAAEIVAKSEK